MADNYTPQTWVDGPAGGTPISADRLTHIETGIDAIDAAVQALPDQTYVDAGDAASRNRANHTGTQAATTITGLATVATSGAYNDLTGKPTYATVATTGSYNDLTATPTIPAAYTDEQAQDATATLFAAGTHTGISFSYNDAGNALSATVSGGAPTLANIPAGSTITVLKDATTGWPARPTSRTDVIVAWKGADPSPSIVSSGTGGMLNNVDYRLVTP